MLWDKVDVNDDMDLAYCSIFSVICEAFLSAGVIITVAHTTIPRREKETDATST